MENIYEILFLKRNKWIIKIVTLTFFFPLMFQFQLIGEGKRIDNESNVFSKSRIHEALYSNSVVIKTIIYKSNFKAKATLDVDKSIEQTVIQNNNSINNGNTEYAESDKSRGVIVGNADVIESDDEFDEFNTTMGYKGEYYYLTDTRDLQKYKVIKIGDVFWFAENLKFKPVNGTYWSYENQASFMPIYGLLYDWETANTACPRGWRLPTDSEWSSLELSLGGRNNAGEDLKSKAGWQKPNFGAENSSGFSAIPSGYRSETGNFSDIRKIGAWWTSSEVNKDNAWYRNLSNENTQVYRYYINKNTGYSVRCVK